MNLELFYLKECPYCIKVFNYLGNRKLDIKLSNISDKINRKRLSEINDGDLQVPCLVIDGKPMLESEDIINRLKSIEE